MLVQRINLPGEHANIWWVMLFGIAILKDTVNSLCGHIFACTYCWTLRYIAQWMLDVSIYFMRAQSPVHHQLNWRKMVLERKKIKCKICTLRNFYFADLFRLKSAHVAFSWLQRSSNHCETVCTFLSSATEFSFITVQFWPTVNQFMTSQRKVYCC